MSNVPEFPVTTGQTLDELQALREKQQRAAQLARQQAAETARKRAEQEAEEQEASK
jgi:hypothetical protein